LFYQPMNMGGFPTSHVFFNFFFQCFVVFMVEAFPMFIKLMPCILLRLLWMRLVSWFPFQ
jgi:hypothetical protein